MTKPLWHAESIEFILNKLNANITYGLTNSEVISRINKYGENSIKSYSQTSWYEMLAKQFLDILIFILFIAAVISFFIGEKTDGITIFTIIIANGILGFVQEWRAERAIIALQKMLSPTCKVIREHHEKIIDVKDLVPGDIVIVEIGNKIPADLRFAETLNLKIDESILTGESDAVHKDSKICKSDAMLATQSNMAWMGTSVTNGRGKGIVVETGSNTEFGRIASLTQTIKKDKTPLQEKLDVFGKQVGIFALVISLFVSIVGFIAGKPLFDMFMVGISLAVAVVPEGLPTVVVLVMALGIRTMAKRKALIRSLKAAETLGSTTVICTDKTGTLTQNEMTVTKIWTGLCEFSVTGVGYNPSGFFKLDGEIIDILKQVDLINLLETGLICNHAKIVEDEAGWEKIGEPTEAALVTASKKAFLSDDERNRISEFSFNSSRKRMSVIEEKDNKWIAHVKGAPEVILERATHIQINGYILELNEEYKEQFKKAYLGFANDGLRTLALARRILQKDIELSEDNIEQQLVLLGVVGIIDPPRPEVALALKVAREAGVHTIMITGDSAETALAIANKIGLKATRAITSIDLIKMSDQDLADVFKQEVVFARTTPENKLRIVTVLKQLGHVVSMTGDGVNDAPALKKADVGIAMGIRGTDVTKSVADIVLTDDNFASIVNAIEEGRRQYYNIKKFVKYLVSSNMAEIVAICANIIIGGPLIFLPSQILWINLLTETVTATALGVEPAEKTVMMQNPPSTKDPILNPIDTLISVAISCYVGVAVLWLFYHFMVVDPKDLHVIDFSKSQAIGFTALIILEKINVFNYRSSKKPLISIGFFTNKWLLLAVAFVVGLQICAIYVPFLQNMLHTVPLTLSDWKIIFLVGLPVFAVPETIKIVRQIMKR